MAELRIVNRTRDTVLAERAEEAATTWGRMRGLLGRKSFPNGEALIIRPCQGVHTVGMAFPIDVLHVRRDGTVRKVLASLRPNRFGPVDFGTSYVVELPAGKASLASTQPGDRLEISS